MATSLSSSIILSASGQSQLAQLKSVNSVKLNKMTAEKTAIASKDTASNKIEDNATALKQAISTVRLSANATDKAAAAKSLVTAFNTLQSSITSMTAKGATLYGTSELRTAKSDLRSNFLDVDVLTDLREAGITTTKDGLTISATADGDLDLETLNKLADVVTKLQTRLDDLQTNYSKKTATLDSSISREQARVDRANVKTTNNFLKMYQIMQQMQSDSGSSSTMSSLLG